ncbi:MAG: divergent polysaccharide deacetylase family protein [Clostridia bacterium]
MGKKSHSRRHLVSASAVYLSIFLVFTALAAAILIIGLSRETQAAARSKADNPISYPSPSDTAGSAAIPVVPLEHPMAAPIQEPGAGVQEKTGHRGTLVFILDDAGHNIWQLEPFLALPFPISIAVLPRLPNTRKAAAMTVSAGKELMLHQPMEAVGGSDPGPGALFLTMEDHEIRLTIRENLAQLPGVVGINNHMGSKATADERIMSIVLDEARRAGVYFVDSLTIAESVVHSVASLMNLRTWERTVFLDNTPDRASIMKYVSEGTKIAEKRGYAIMIGHVWSAELAQTLSDLYPQLVEQGFSLSTISRIMMDGDDDEDFGN